MRTGSTVSCDPRSAVSLSRDIGSEDPQPVEVRDPVQQ